jgi:fatty acid CoA ligase FadD9
MLPSGSFRASVGAEPGRTTAELLPRFDTITYREMWDRVRAIAAALAWLQRFEATLRALREQQRQASFLPLLHNFQRPEKPTRRSIAPTERLRSAVQEAKIGPDKDIPHISPPVIVKYITDLQLLGLL